MARACFGLMMAALSMPAAAEPPHIAVSLAAESVMPAGATTLAIVMRPAPGWHGYWLNPGDAGLAPRVTWRLPNGAAVGPLRFPTPTRLMLGGLANYVFEGEHPLLAEMRLPQRPAGTPLPVTASVRLLACSATLCVPEQAELSIRLRAGRGEIAPSARAWFDGWRRTIPAPLVGATYRVDGRTLRLTLPIGGARFFFPADPGLIDQAAAQTSARRPAESVIEVPLVGTPKRRIEGVVTTAAGARWIAASTAR